MIIEDSIKDIDPAKPRVVLVTGATGNVGRALARQFAGPDCSLALQYRSREIEAANLLESLASPAARTYRADLTSASETAAMVAQIEADLGGVDVLIHAAAPVIGLTWPLVDDEEEYSAQLRTNVTAFLRLCRLVLPGMMERQSGTIVPLLSTVVDAARPKNWAAYTTAKFALVGALCGLTTDIDQTGVRLVGLMPGRVLPAEEIEASAAGLVKAADLAALAQRICEDARQFPHGRIARISGNQVKVGSFGFSGQAIASNDVG